MATLLPRLGSFGALLRDNVQPVVAAVAALGQLGVGVFAYFGWMRGAFWEHPYLWIGLLWLACVVVAAWPARRATGLVDAGGRPLTRPRFSTWLRLAWVALGSAAALAAATLVWQEDHRIVRPQPISIPFETPPGLWAPLLGTPAFGAETAPSASAAFVEGRSSLLSEDSPTQLAMAPNPRLLRRFLYGEDAQDAVELADLPEIRQWLRARAQRLGHPQYLRRLGDQRDVLIRLTSERSDIVRALVPGPAELAQLPERERDVVVRWIVRYVGQWNPRLRCSVSNRDLNRELSVEGARLDLAEVSFDRQAGATPPPRAALLDTFFMRLRPARGPQRSPFNAQGAAVSIPPGATRQLDLVLCPDPERHDNAVRIRCRGTLWLETSSGAVRVRQISLDTYNCWNPAALLNARQ